jgi:hypothetical protein
MAKLRVKNQTLVHCLVLWKYNPKKSDFSSSNERKNVFELLKLPNLRALNPNTTQLKIVISLIACHRQNRSSSWSRKVLSQLFSKIFGSYGRLTTYKYIIYWLLQILCDIIYFRAVLWYETEFINTTVL